MTLRDRLLRAWRRLRNWWLQNDWVCGICGAEDYEDHPRWCENDPERACWRR